jgi:hypothetical protein
VEHEMNYAALRDGAKLVRSDAQELNIVRQKVSRRREKEREAAGHNKTETREEQERATITD